ncbi:MAG: calcium-binding protein [Gemmataceae bacterium]
MKWFLSMFKKRKLRVISPRSKTALRCEKMEDRITPTITITGTPGDDTVTSRFFFDTDANQYRGEILLNGTVVSSFLGELWPYPYPKMSIYLPEPLSVDTLGGNDSIDLSAFRDPVFPSQANMIHGGEGNDTIVGTDGVDFIYGDAGADRINSGYGTDHVFADGNDLSLLPGSNSDFDELNFDNFAGTMRFTLASVSFNGTICECNNFTILRITGSSGNDTFDLAQFVGNQVYISAGAGADTIITNAQLGVIDGGDGDDTIVSIYNNRGPTQILGGAGNDKITVSSATTVYGGPGNDILDARNYAVNGFYTPGVSMYGEDGNDTIYGSPVVDFLNGGNGTDAIFGGDGNDFLDGSQGKDSISGDGGDDIILGDTNDSFWSGGTGRDQVDFGVTANKAVVTDNYLRFDNDRINWSESTRSVLRERQQQQFRCFEIQWFCLFRGK